VIENGALVNVCTSEIYGANVGIKSGKITCVGDKKMSAEETVNARGYYLVPGLIDAHIHIESSMITLSEFARTVIPHGTAAIVTDPHEIANVAGIEGIKVLVEESRKIPLKVYFTIPSCVPSTPFETSGAEIGIKEIEEMLSWKEVVGLGEVMNFHGVINSDPEVLEKIRVVKEMRGVVDGHCPGLSGEALNAYISAGVQSDHESTTAGEGLEKIRSGMRLMIREGSAAKNLGSLSGIFDFPGEYAGRCMLATDDRHPGDLISEGHMDGIIRKSVSGGMDPVDAIKLATINPAEYFHLENSGYIAPGKDADILFVSDLEDFRVEKVMIKGKITAEKGRFISKLLSFPYPGSVTNTVNLKRVSPGSFNILAGKENKVDVRVIGVIGGEILTDERIECLQVRDNKILPDPGRDVARIAVAERHKGTGNIGLGFVSGFGLKKGAFASSVAHDSHNIIVVGSNENDMCDAVNKIIETRGGMVVAHNREIHCLKLPIAGLISDMKAEEVNEKLGVLHREVKKLGVKMESPFMALSFLALPVIPRLKLTDKGLFDVERFKFVDLVVNL